MCSCMLKVRLDEQSQLHGQVLTKLARNTPRDSNPIPGSKESAKTYLRFFCWTAARDAVLSSRIGRKRLEKIDLSQIICLIAQSKNGLEEGWMPKMHVVVLGNLKCYVLDLSIPNVRFLNNSRCISLFSLEWSCSPSRTWYRLEMELRERKLGRQNWAVRGSMGFIKISSRAVKVHPLVWWDNGRRPTPGYDDGQ